MLRPVQWPAGWPAATHQSTIFCVRQCELRVLAHFSQDPALLHAFQHNIDRRRRTAARVLGIAESDVTDPQRQLGKTSNFGIAYGQTACVRQADRDRLLQGPAASGLKVR